MRQARASNNFDFRKWYNSIDEETHMISLVHPAQVKTDCWGGYKGMEAHFPKLIREKSGKKREKFKQMHR